MKPCIPIFDFTFQNREAILDTQVLSAEQGALVRSIHHIHAVAAVIVIYAGISLLMVPIAFVTVARIE